MMDRVETLCKKLQEQLSQNAGADQLLLTVQMLQSELLHIKSSQQPSIEPQAAAINIPSNFEMLAPEKVEERTTAEKTVLVLEVDEAEVEAELEEIKRNAKTREQISVHNKPQLLFDPIEDIPTLTHQGPQKEKGKEIHETIGSNEISLNDKLKQAKIELSDALQDSPVKDLKKAIGINDRFLFIRELFRGDEVMYERSIKTINGFSIFPEAEYWIKRELKLKLGWNDSSPEVKLFDQIVKRRFPSI
ncbi:MAG: hypothetical protein KBF74_12270 [Ferruginibacter sp.]|nr:hypothetical protein [Ferruginibacter sp.]